MVKKIKKIKKGGKEKMKKKTIKEIVYEAVKWRKRFTLNDLRREVYGYMLYPTDETILRILRKLRQEGRINYKALGKCKFENIGGDNDA